MRRDPALTRDHIYLESSPPLLGAHGHDSVIVSPDSTQPISIHLYGLLHERRHVEDRPFFHAPTESSQEARVVLHLPLCNVIRLARIDSTEAHDGAESEKVVIGKTEP